MGPAELERFLLTIAPELPGLYVLGTHTLPGDFPVRFGECQVAAMTNAFLDLMLRDFLPNYAGRAPALLLNSRVVNEEVAQLVASGYCTDEAEQLVACRLGCHELAHIVVRKPPFYADGPNSTPTLETLAHAACAVAAAEDAKPNCVGHDAQFVRAALHLVHRARRAGVDLRPAEVVPYDFYGLSPAKRYLEALGDEPARMEGKAFCDILTEPEPAAFVELWTKDTGNPDQKGKR